MGTDKTPFEVRELRETERVQKDKNIRRATKSTIFLELFKIKAFKE